MFNYLIQGFDTIECSYYLMRMDDCKLDFIELDVQKQLLKHGKSKQGKPISLGSEDFMLASHGSSSGYPFMMENDAFIIQFGEMNRPNFFVKYRSIALWHHGALALHNLLLLGLLRLV